MLAHFFGRPPAKQAAPEVGLLLLIHSAAASGALQGSAKIGSPWRIWAGGGCCCFLVVRGAEPRGESVPQSLQSV